MYLKSLFPAHLPKRSTACHLGKEALRPGMSYVSHICELEDKYTREDYCIHCWETLQKKQRNTEGSYWIGKIPLKKQEPVQYDHRAFALFRELLQSSENDQKLLTLLALYLERQKLIERRPQMKDRSNSTVQFYEVIETGEMIGIQLCSLSQEDSEKMIHQLKQRL